MVNDAERFAQLRLIRASGIGAATFWALIERFGTAMRAIEGLPNLVRKSAKARPFVLASEADIEREIQQSERRGARIIAHGEDDYPEGLANLEAPPPIVTVKGNASVLNRTIIAIVGARNASALGQRFAGEIARDLGSAGIV